MGQSPRRIVLQHYSLYAPVWTRIPTGAKSFPKNLTANDQHNNVRHYSGEHVRQELFHRRYLLLSPLPRKGRVGLGRLPRKNYNELLPPRKRGFPLWRLKEGRSAPRLRAERQPPAFAVPSSFQAKTPIRAHLCKLACGQICVRSARLPLWQSTIE